MSVIINGVPYEDYEREPLDEFVILDFIRDFVNSKLPSDISYFDHRKLDELFREIDRNNGKSEDYAYVLYAIIMNIGNAARQPSSLEKCYKQRIRYKRTISYYFNKYKNKLAPDGRAKLRHAIESQFKHFEINPIKMALQMIQVDGEGLTTAALKLIKNQTANQIVGSLVDMYTNWLAIKYYDLLEAVRVYKRSINTEFDIDDMKSVKLRFALKSESEYFYEVARAVLDDILKVYDQL